MFPLRCLIIYKIRWLKFLTSAATLQEYPSGSNLVTRVIPVFPAIKYFQNSSFPTPIGVTRPRPMTTKRFSNSLISQFVGIAKRTTKKKNYSSTIFLLMKSRISLTVGIFSASISGISPFSSFLNSSSNAITSSTVSSDSAPRSRNVF